MKANELMIGDWVSCDGKPVRVNCVGVSSVGLEGVESDTICKDNMIEPIPLSTDILEKNGFSCRDTWYIPGEDLGLRQEVDGWGLLPYYQEYYDFAFSYIQYVHELQHALKLCGIDKEIIL